MPSLTTVRLASRLPTRFIQNCTDAALIPKILEIVASIHT